MGGSGGRLCVSVRREKGEAGCCPWGLLVLQPPGPSSPRPRALPSRHRCQQRAARDTSCLRVQGIAPGQPALPLGDARQGGTAGAIGPDPPAPERPNSPESGVSAAPPATPGPGAPRGEELGRTRHTARGAPLPATSRGQPAAWAWPPEPSPRSQPLPGVRKVKVGKAGEPHGRLPQQAEWPAARARARSPMTPADGHRGDPQPRQVPSTRPAPPNLAPAAAGRGGRGRGPAAWPARPGRRSGRSSAGPRSSGRSPPAPRGRERPGRRTPQPGRARPGPGKGRSGR